MKLRNKKTGEIGYLTAGRGVDHYVVADDNWKSCGRYKSLAELNDEWEDAPEEPKEYWVVDYLECGVDKLTYDPGSPEIDEFNKQIGNYFETEEEAERAVEKLKAWKRLKDKGFRFTGWDTNEGIRGVDFEVPDSFFSEHNHSCISDETRNDLDLLFWSEG